MVIVTWDALSTLLTRAAVGIEPPDTMKFCATMPVVFGVMPVMTALSFVVLPLAVIGVLTTRLNSTAIFVQPPSG